MIMTLMHGISLMSCKFLCRLSNFDITYLFDLISNILAHLTVNNLYVYKLHGADSFLIS